MFGQKHLFSYSKDGSVNRDADAGWVVLTYEKQASVGNADVPAEEKEPTCTEDVVCDYCGTVVKEATGHTVEEWYENAEGNEEGECSVCMQTILREANNN